MEDTSHHIGVIADDAAPGEAWISVPWQKDPYGKHSDTNTREFLRQKICAAWDIKRITPFFSLLECDTRWEGTLGSIPNFNQLSIESVTALQVMAETWDMEKTRDTMGEHLCQAFADPLVQCPIGRGKPRKLSGSLETQLFVDLMCRLTRERESSSNSTQVAPTGAVNTTNTNPQTQRLLEVSSQTEHTHDVATDEVYVPVNLRITHLAGQEETADICAMDTSSGLNVHRISLGTSKLIYDEMSTQIQRDSLLRLDKEVIAAALNRDGYILKELRANYEHASNRLWGLGNDREKEKHVQKTLELIENLRRECEIVFDEGDAPGDIGWIPNTLNTLKESTVQRVDKRPRDYTEEENLLQQHQKRVKDKAEPYEKRVQSIGRVAQYYKDQRPDLE